MIEHRHLQVNKGEAKPQLPEPNIEHWDLVPLIYRAYPMLGCSNVYSPILSFLPLVHFLPPGSYRSMSSKTSFGRVVKHDPLKRTSGANQAVGSWSPVEASVPN